MANGKKSWANPDPKDCNKIIYYDLGLTCALINNFFTFDSVLAVIVTTLFCIPGLLLESNCTCISPEPPTGIGCFGH